MRHVPLGTSGRTLLGASGLAAALVVAGLAAVTARAGDGPGTAPDGAPPAAAEPGDHVVRVPSFKGTGPESLSSEDGLQGFVAPVGGGRILTPAVGRRAIFTGTGNQMMAFDALDGRLLWVSTTDDGGPTAVVLMGGRVVFNTASCTLYSVSERSGDRQWSHWIAGSVVTTPAVSGDRVFVSGPAEGGGLKLECLRLSTGAKVFVRSVPAELISAPVVVGEKEGEQRIFLSLVTGTVMALDGQGKTLWSRESEALAAPWPAGERLLVASGDPGAPTLVALDPATGAGDTRAVATPRDDPRGDGPDAGPPSGDGDSKGIHFMMSGSRNNRGAGRAGGAPRPGIDSGPGKDPTRPSGGTPAPSPPPAGSGAPNPRLPGIGGLGYEGPRPCTVGGVAALAAGRSLLLFPAEGGAARKVPLGGDGTAAGAAVAAGDLVIVATTDGRILGFDPGSGERRFGIRFVGETGNVVLASSPAVVRGRAYVGTADGRVLGIDLPDASADGWPMWGGGPGRSR